MQRFLRSVVLPSVVLGLRTTLFLALSFLCTACTFGLGDAVTPPKQVQKVSVPTINGNGKTAAGTVGTIDILDHLYSESGKTDVWEVNTTGPVTFSKPVPYAVTFKGGTQEGVIMLSASNASSNMLTGIVLMKVLLSA